MIITTQIQDFYPNIVISVMSRLLWRIPNKIYVSWMEGYMKRTVRYRTKQYDKSA